MCMCSRVKYTKLGLQDSYNVWELMLGLIEVQYAWRGKQSYLDSAGFPGGSVGKNPPASVGDSGKTGSVLESGRSPGEGNKNPLQYSCLGSHMDRGAWRATVPGIAKSRTQLSSQAHMQYLKYLFK